MLNLAYLGEAKQLHLNESITKHLIVRRPVGAIPQGFIHLPELSPSIELFENTKRWKQGLFSEKERILLAKKGISQLTTDSWWQLYRDAFNFELNTRPDMVKALQKLQYRLQKGEDIYLFCYCKDVERCHRWLIGMYFVDRGFQVDFRKKEYPLLQPSLF